MKTRLKQSTIEIAPYGVKLHILVGPLAEAQKFFAPIDSDQIPNCTAYCAYIDPFFYIYLNTDQNLSIGYICHELIHVSWLLDSKCNLIDGGFNYGSQEVQAYMVGDLTDRVLAALKIMKIKIK